jgi:hypothetical protein
MTGKKKGSGHTGIGYADFFCRLGIGYEKRLAAGAAENGPQICSSEAVATAAG